MASSSWMVLALTLTAGQATPEAPPQAAPGGFWDILPIGQRTTEIAFTDEAPVDTAEVPFHERDGLPRVWGTAGAHFYFVGDRMAPNGLEFSPLFTGELLFNIELLPQKKVYLFSEMQFWGQKATEGITHSRQGNFDFSKREFDFTADLAWTWARDLEFRVLGYANNNLNRELDPDQPRGFNDGWGVEQRFYLDNADPYDVGKLGFFSIGYLPSKELVGADGQNFLPGLFLRAYLTHNFKFLNSYTYLDVQLMCERSGEPRTIYIDKGFGARPFEACPFLEFRIGLSDTYDFHADPNRILGYGTIRLYF